MRISVLKGRKKRLLSGTVTLLTAVCLIAACGSPGSNASGSAQSANSNGGSSSGSSQAPAPSTSTSAANSGTAASESGNSSSSAGVNYPLNTTTTLTYWMPFPAGNLQGVVNSVADAPFFQDWQKRTGVTLKFTSPPVNQEKEALNVMLASGDLPDMIEYDWADVPGGPQKALDDGSILKLNDVIDKYAPNLKKYLQAHPDIDKQVKTDDGSYYVFPFIRGDQELLLFNGPVIRKDWLDKVNMPVPVTIDDWYNTLKAFKDKLGIKSPLTFESAPNPLQDLNNGAFVGAWGVNRSFYIDDNGKIQYGPIQPGYKQFLATFAKWYNAGLIDKNIATVDRKTEEANITSGASGATITYAGSGIGKLEPVLKQKDPNADLVAAPYPVLQKGDVPQFGQMDFAYAKSGSVAITPKSKNVKLDAELLDYAYSDAGHMFFNFGTEGTSYTMVNGNPVYTDLLMKNPKGLAPVQAMSMYIRANYNGPFVQDKRYIEQYYTLPSQKDSVKTWKTDAQKHEVPPITPTPSESSQLASIMNDVQTVVDEMSLKIILGAEPVSSFDSYVDKIKSLNIDKAIQIEQAALDRYNKR